MPTMAATKTKTHIVLSAAALVFYANGLVNLVQDLAQTGHHVTPDDRAFIVSVVLGLLYIISPLIGISISETTTAEMIPLPVETITPSGTHV